MYTIEIYTDEEFKEIVKNSGLSTKEIFAYGKDKFISMFRLGNVLTNKTNNVLLRYSVVQICRKHGYKNYFSKKVLYRLYRNSGKTYEDIARYCNMSTVTIWQYMNVHSYYISASIGKSIYNFLKGANHVVKNAGQN